MNGMLFQRKGNNKVEGFYQNKFNVRNLKLYF